METEIIKISDISIRKGGTRTARNAKAQAELTNSVKQYGILQPITLKEDAKKQGKYFVVMGRGRYLAAKEAGLKTVPAFISVLEEDALENIELQENLTREDLSIIDEANVVRKLNATKNLPEIAAILCKSVEWVLIRQRISKLPVEIQEAYLAGKFSKAKLTLASELSPEDLETSIASLKEGKIVSFNFERKNLAKASFDLNGTTYTNATPCSQCPLNSSVNTLFDSEAGMCSGTNCYEQKTVDAKRFAIAEWVANGGLVMLSQNDSRESLPNNIPDECVITYGWRSRIEPVKLRDTHGWKDGEYQVISTIEEARATALAKDPTYFELYGVTHNYMVTPAQLDILRDEAIIDAERQAKQQEMEDKTPKVVLSEGEKAIIKTISGKQERFDSYAAKHNVRKSEFVIGLLKEHIATIKIPDHVIMTFDKKNSLASELFNAACINAAGYMHRNLEIEEKINAGFRDILSKGIHQLMSDDYSELLNRIYPGLLDGWVKADKEAIEKRRVKFTDAKALLEKELAELREEQLRNPQPIAEPIIDGGTDEDEDWEGADIYDELSDDSQD